MAFKFYRVAVSNDPKFMYSVEEWKNHENGFNSFIGVVESFNSRDEANSFIEKKYEEEDGK